MENLFCITGLRGGGKETVVKHILSSGEIPLSRIVPFTTRNKREEEEDGREYFFIKKEHFWEIKESGDILYSVQIGENSNPNHYFSGTLRSEFDRHTNGIIDITVDGARILSHYTKRSLLFYMYAHPEERLIRIMSRQNMSKNEALELMSNEPSPCTLSTIDNLYPDFSIVYNHDGEQGQAENFVKNNINQFLNHSTVSVY